MCNSGAGEDMEHLLVTCGEFERDQWGLIDEASRIVGTGEWLRNMENCARRKGNIAVGERHGRS